MKATFEHAKVILDGEIAYLCIGIPSRDAKKFVGETKPKRYAVEIKEYREHRSLDANAYMWKLLDEMAEAKSLMEEKACTKEELYLDYVKEVGPYKDFTLSEDQAKTFRVAWSMLGTGWPTEQVDFSPDGEQVVIRAYYGSSQYNKKQMSRLIDMVVQDAKALGVETLTPMELARMTDRWGK